MLKKIFLLIVMLVLISVPCFAIADDYDQEFSGGYEILDGAIGGYLQTQGGVDLYIENGAFQNGDMAGSADIVLMQTTSQIQMAGAYAPNTAIYEYHNGYGYGYYEYGYSNWNDQLHREPQGAEILVAPIQGYEKTTIANTGFGTIEMTQKGVQTGIVHLVTNSNNYNECN